VYSRRRRTVTAIARLKEPAEVPNSPASGNCWPETPIPHAKIVSTMSTDAYPRVTIRLQPAMIRRVSLLARSRHMSNAAVIREALTQYFRGSVDIDDPLRSYSKS